MNPLAVAVHRWFARGEGWAYNSPCAAACAPDVAGSLNLLFDRHLKDPTPGRHSLRAEQRAVWLIDIATDTQPLDPRIQPSDTTILRAVLLPYVPNSLLEDRLRQQLARLDPDQPGEQSSLEMHLIAEEKPIVEPRGRVGIPVYVPILAALALVAVAALIVFPPWHLFSRIQLTSQAVQEQRMLDWVQRWSGTRHSSRTNVAQAYFAQLKRPAEVVRLDPEAHPYLAYLLTFPETSLLPEESADEAALRSALRNLLERFGDRRWNDEDPTESLVDRVGEAITFEQWWLRLGRWQRYTRLSEKPPASICSRVAQLRQPDTQLQESAKKLNALLARWGVPLTPEQARNPDLILQTFFDFTSRGSLTYSQLRPDHPDTVFIARLPEHPLVEGRLLVEPGELLSALCQLLRQLAPDLPATDPCLQQLTPCIQRLSRELDYTYWVTQGQGKRAYRHAEQSIDPQVARLAARFR